MRPPFWFKFIPLAVSFIIIFTGGLVLAGWLLEITALKSVLPGLVTMKANTALAFLLAGLALGLLERKPRIYFMRFLCRLCAGTVFLIGLFTSGEYLFNLNFGIDQLLFKEAAGAIGTLSPGRMAPTTAVSFLFLGLALIFLGTKSYAKIARFLALPIGLFGLITFMGYLYGVKEFYGIAMYTQMALHTALAFIILSLGIFFILAEGQPTPILFKESLGGALARRMLALVVLVLLAVGWLGLQGELAGLYNNVFAFALVILIVAVILVIVVLNNAKAIDKLDHLRQQTEEKVKQRYYAEWDKTFNFISDSIFIMDCDHTIINANKAFFNLLHVRPEDTLGKNCYEVMHKLNKPWPNCPLVKTKTDKKVYTAEVDDPAIGVPLLVTTSPIFDDKGELIAIVHVSKDISELKRVENALRESEEKYRELFLSSSDALMTLTPGGKFSSGNPMAIKIFGCSSEEEFISKTPAELSPQYQSDGSLSQVKAKRMMDIAMEKGTHFFEWTHKRLNNEEFPATVLLTKIKIKGAEFLQASVRDISEAKRLESDLKERIRALERFQEITVDRELKMKELKERIKELEGKILKLQNADKS